MYEKNNNDNEKVSLGSILSKWQNVVTVGMDNCQITELTPLK